MSLLGPIIGAAGSILGGFLSKPKRVSARDETRDGILGQAEGARLAGEQFGFNPLTLLGVSSPLGSSYTPNPMGSAIADAGLLLADGIAKNGTEKSRMEQVERENMKLREKVTNLTIRPKVGGLYAQNEVTPEYKGPAVMPDITGPDGGFVYPGRPKPRPVRVYHAVTGKWSRLDGDVARRLRLRDGDPIMADDFEAIHGDLPSEVIAASAAANSVITGKDAVKPLNEKKAKPKKKDPKNPSHWRGQ